MSLSRNKGTHKQSALETELSRGSIVLYINHSYEPPRGCGNIIPAPCLNYPA